jgi:hypothetical protein
MSSQGVQADHIARRHRHRKYVATLTAVANALSEPQVKTKSFALRAEERFAV